MARPSLGRNLRFKACKLPCKSSERVVRPVSPAIREGAEYFCWLAGPFQYVLLLFVHPTGKYLPNPSPATFSFLTRIRQSHEKSPPAGNFPCRCGGNNRARSKVATSNSVSLAKSCDVVTHVQMLNQQSGSYLTNLLLAASRKCTEEAPRVFVLPIFLERQVHCRSERD